MYSSHTQAEFQDTIMWLQDSGILNKLKYDAMNPTIRIPDPKVRHKQPLILKQVGIMMITLAGGLTVALMVFAGEHWVPRKVRRTTELTESFPLQERRVITGHNEERTVHVCWQ